MISRRTVALSAAALVVARPAFSSTGAQALAGDRFRLDTQEYYLTDILAPSQYDLHREAEPFFAEAKAMLAKLLPSELQLQKTDSVNRWGAQPASVNIGDETLQEKLVAAGAARVAPVTDDYELIDRLLVVEGQARRSRAGLWRFSHYKVFDAAKAEGAIDGYNIIEGEVVEATDAKGRLYLNFGADFRTDFTTNARTRLSKRWAKDGLDLASLSGARLRVRGFVERINGPSIELTHPKQIERLS